MKKGILAFITLSIIGLNVYSQEGTADLYRDECKEKVHIGSHHCPPSKRSAIVGTIGYLEDAAINKIFGSGKYIGYNSDLFCLPGHALDFVADNGDCYATDSANKPDNGKYVCFKFPSSEHYNCMTNRERHYNHALTDEEINDCNGMLAGKVNYESSAACGPN